MYMELVLVYSRMEDSRSAPYILEWNANRLLYARMNELIKLWPVGSWESDYKLKNGKVLGFLGIPFEQLEENKEYKVVVDPDKEDTY